MLTKAIDRYDYKFWIIKKIDSIRCQCLDPITKEADKNCQLCLGLGRKIKIYRATGASRESKEFETIKSDNTSVTPKVFYVKSKIYLDKGDIIVDKECVYQVYARQYHRGENGEFKFTRAVCPNLKHNRNAFLKNFREKLNEYLLRKK